MKTIAGAAVLLMLSGATASAGKIENACLKSDRQAASRSLCGCIQRVADATLTRSDQRLAAEFFEDPHLAQVIRQSDQPSHEVFWKKYKAFGQTAQTYCG